MSNLIERKRVARAHGLDLWYDRRARLWVLQGDATSDPGLWTPARHYAPAYLRDFHDVMWETVCTMYKHEVAERRAATQGLFDLVG